MPSAARTLHACMTQRAGIIGPSFKAWRITETRNNHPIDLGQCGDLNEAVNTAAPRCDHKDHFAVLETHPVSGRQFVHVHAVKRESKAKWRRDPVTGETVCMARLYPVLLFSMEVKAFDPVEPWKWSPGADVVGVDRNEVAQ